MTSVIKHGGRDKGGAISSVDPHPKCHCVNDEINEAIFYTKMRVRDSIEKTLVKVCCFY